MTRISKWSAGVATYAAELREILEDNQLEPTERNLLNGASDWREYSWGGCALIYNRDIAERLATPSEIRSRTRKDGSINPQANAREHWLDVQTRALYQAADLIIRGEA